MVPLNLILGVTLASSSGSVEQGPATNVNWASRHLAVHAQVGTFYGTGAGFEGRFWKVRILVLGGFVVKTGQRGFRTDGIVGPQDGPSPPPTMGSGMIVDSDTIGTFTIRLPGIESSVGEVGIGMNYAFHQWATSGAGVSVYGDLYLDSSWKLGVTVGSMIFPDLSRATSSWKIEGVPMIEGLLVFGFSAGISWGSRW